MVPVESLGTDEINQCGINPFSTALPLWGQTLQIISSCPQNGTAVLKGLIVCGVVPIGAIVPVLFAGAYIPALSEGPSLLTGRRERNKPTDLVDVMRWDSLEELDLSNAPLHPLLLSRTLVQQSFSENK